MMLVRRSLSVSSKTPLQHFAVLHLRHIDQTPSRKPTAASPADLIREQTNDSVLDTVVMRLHYSFLTFVSEPEQVLLCNRLSKYLIDFLIDRGRITLRQFIARLGKLGARPVQNT